MSLLQLEKMTEQVSGETAHPDYRSAACSQALL